MHLDVTELMAFYAKQPGATVRRLLVRRLRSRWPNVSGETVMGLGFATPYLRVFREEAARIIALMPAGQGVLAWPREGPYQSALAAEDAYPLPDGSVDKLIAVHSVEMSERVHSVLREIWRVLAPEGRLLLIVPNRRSVWAGADSTPFGHGRPYSRSQLERLLTDALFTPLDWSSALYVPPLRYGLIWRSATAWERVGIRLWPWFAGVIVVEATKQLHAPIGSQKARARLVRVGAAVANRTRPINRQSENGACATERRWPEHPGDSAKQEGRHGPPIGPQDRG